MFILPDTSEFDKMGNERILYALNVKSGSSENADVEKNISGIMMKSDHLFDIFHLNGEDLSIRLKERIDRWKPDIVVAAGGDGTINLVASLLSGTQSKLGIIPLGSANGLASELGIPNRLEDAVQLILAGKTRPLDLIQINDGHISLHLSDVGINARIIKEFEKEGKRGIMAYFKHFIKELLKPQPSFVCTTVADGTKYTQRAYMTLIANCNRYGSGAVINPSGKWDDGLFEVIVIRPHKHWIWRSFIGAFTGTFHLQPHIEVYQLWLV
jgi:diacylglycerol kinase (ATP)